MRKLLLTFLFIFNTILAQFIFTDLRGLEDKSGNTHLFYRMGQDKSVTNSIYHMNINENSDSLFLFAYSFPYDYYYGISDYDFIEGDPHKYIWCGSAIMPDNIGYIAIYNNLGGFSKFDAINNIELSKQDTNLIYADYNGYLIKSTDYGLTWNDDPIDSLPYIRLSSVSPFNDKIIFGIESNEFISKSIDGGNTFIAVDSSGWTINKTNILFDMDSSTIYAITSRGDKWYLFLSTNSGNSFKRIYESNQELIVAIDSSRSGRIFLCEENNILKSDDYGKTFNLYNNQPSSVNGIYAKPKSDKVYIATPNSLIELSDQGSLVLKSLTNINEKINVLDNFFLSQNFPNPFNPKTKIKYSIPNSEGTRHGVFPLVDLKVYDILGNEITTLVNEVKPAGNYEVEFDGSRLSSGIYFYVLNAGGQRLSKKMCLLK